MSELTAFPSAPVSSSEETSRGAENLGPTLDWRKVLATPEAKAAILVLLALCLAFAGYLKKVSDTWFEAESLYSHGPLIPLMAAYIVYERWPKLRQIPIRGVTSAILPLAFGMYCIWFASRATMMGTLSFLLVFSLATSVLFIGGWRWFLATLGPTLYLIFALPVWGSIVDRVTQPLQVLSTDMAVKMLEIVGLHPVRMESTSVYLDHFQFDVAAACSGAKLTLALLAFSVFFILLNRGRWYSAVALLAILVPFSLVVNGLRIALVGLIGNEFGTSAGMMFHDYGGYGVLILCFVLLAQITRLLGFKQ